MINSKHEKMPTSRFQFPAHNAQRVMQVFDLTVAALLIFYRRLKRNLMARSCTSPPLAASAELAELAAPSVECPSVSCGFG